MHLKLHTYTKSDSARRSAPGRDLVPRRACAECSCLDRSGPAAQHHRLVEDLHAETRVVSSVHSRGTCSHSISEDRLERWPCLEPISKVLHSKPLADILAGPLVGLDADRLCVCVLGQFLVTYRTLCTFGISGTFGTFRAPKARKPRKALLLLCLHSARVATDLAPPLVPRARERLALHGFPGAPDVVLCRRGA